MFPLRDTKSTNIYPLITHLLIAINAVVFFLEFSAPDTDAFISRYALIPAEINFSAIASLTPFITSQFLHAGLFHLISNMWFLNIFGDNVEEKFGFFFYPFVYLISGTAGGLLQYIFAPSSNIPMLGASGAVAGVLGAYFVLFPRHKVETLIPLGFFVTSADLPAKLMLFYWFITQVFSGLGSIATIESGGVAFWAHAGGFVTGYLFAKLLPEKDYEEGELIS